jgi:hypothetical protein
MCFLKKCLGLLILVTLVDLYNVTYSLCLCVLYKIIPHNESPSSYKAEVDD